MRGLVFRSSAKLHPKEAGSQRSPICGVPLYLCIHPLTQNYLTSRGNRYGEGAYFWMVSHAPTTKWTGSQRLPIWGFLSIFASPFVTELSNLTWGQPRLPSQESRVLGLCNFGGFHPYLCLHPLTQNDQIRHGNT